MAARFTLSDRLSGMWRSNRTATACMPPLWRACPHCDASLCRHREAIEPGRVVADDRAPLVLGDVGEDLVENRLGAWERGLGVWVVGAPHQRLDADDVPH